MGIYMENFVENIYFLDVADADDLSANIYHWTPLKTKLGSRTVGGVKYLVLTVYWDENPGVNKWCPSDDWIFPSKRAAQLSGLLQPDFMSDVLPKWEHKFKFVRFPAQRKTPEELFKERLNIAELVTLEGEAISDAKSRIFDCSNHTVEGYTECVRSAFAPVFLAYKHRGLEAPAQEYKDILLKTFDDRFSEVVHKGIEAGFQALLS